MPSPKPAAAPVILRSPEGHRLIVLGRRHRTVHLNTSKEPGPACEKPAPRLNHYVSLPQAYSARGESVVCEDCCKKLGARPVVEPFRR